MSTLALTLLDFQTALPFSTQIEDRQVQPFVELSRTLDLAPLLGFAVLEDVDALPDAVLKPYFPDQTVAADDLLVRRERVYRALLATPTTPPPTSASTTTDWQYEPLATLWAQYLKPYWLHAAFSRFLAQHGLNLTKAGITVPTDPQGTYTRPSSADKAALQAATDSTAEALRSKLTAFLRAETIAYTADNATGYNYGTAHEACHSLDPHRTRLRGINRPAAPHAYNRSYPTNWR